jgi:hypothetical protein
MSIDTLVEAVVLAINDTSFEDVVEDYINLGRGEIAGLVDLPALLTVATVATTATANTVALPATYSRNLFWVSNATGRIGKPGRGYYDLMGYLSRNPIAQTGPIFDVCVQGNSILYQGAAVDTLTLRFYAEPTSEEPDELPTHLQKPLLFNYACKEIFNLIEDGIEGAKVNTNKYERDFNMALGKLAAWAEGIKPREPKVMADSQWW